MVKTASESSMAQRLAEIAWPEAAAGLWQNGYARLGNVMARAECEQLRGLYSRTELFRSRIEMARYRFGRGEYQYFADPLPPLVSELRRELYARLFAIANEWMAKLGMAGDFPADLEKFLARCHARGQKRPTPLMLHYRQGDYNCLHQDIYGEVVFPFQVVIGLSRPEQEYTGGELLLVEQRPRAQSVGHAIRLEQGEAVAITTRYRPVEGSRGFYRANLKHGVSPILSGERFTLGVIFHDAE